MFIPDKHEDGDDRPLFSPSVSHGSDSHDGSPGDAGGAAVLILLMGVILVIVLTLLSK